MKKVLDIFQSVTEGMDEAFVTKQIEKMFCLTQGIHGWYDLDSLNKLNGKPGEVLPFPGKINPSCKCFLCVGMV